MSATPYTALLACAMECDSIEIHHHFIDTKRSIPRVIGHSTKLPKMDYMHLPPRSVVWKTDYTS